MIRNDHCILTAVAAGWAFAASAVRAQDIDIPVGRTAAGQLKVGGFDFADIIPLDPTSGILNGWAENQPGFVSLFVAQPENDWYPLEPGATIWLEVVALDPALQVVTPGLIVLDQPGEDTFLGNHQFDRHLTWHINSDSPQFETQDCVWEGTFFVRDDGSTNYADSAHFTLRFTNLPAAQANADCNGNNFPDVCDSANGSSPDINCDAVPDECQCSPADCADADICTNDICSPGLACTHDAIALLQYGDTDISGAVDVGDILCVLDGFSGCFRCPLERVDLTPCSGDSKVDVGDVLAALDAFAGTAACPDPCPQ